MKSEVIFENYNNFSPARKLAGLENYHLQHTDNIVHTRKH